MALHSAPCGSMQEIGRTSACAVASKNCVSFPVLQCGRIFLAASPYRLEGVRIFPRCLYPFPLLTGAFESSPRCLCPFTLLARREFYPRQAPLGENSIRDGRGAAFALGGICPNCSWISGRAPAAPGRDIGPSGRTSSPPGPSQHYRVIDHPLQALHHFELLLASL